MAARMRVTSPMHIMLLERWTFRSVRHVERRAKQHLISVSLRSRPASTAHRFDDGPRREVVEVAGGGGDGRVAELAGDDGDVDAFGAELSGVGVAQAIGMHALLDARALGKAFEHHADVRIAHVLTAERAEDGVAAA